MGRSSTDVHSGQERLGQGTTRWSSFTLFLDDCSVAIGNNVTKRGMRPIGVGRYNWLFAGPDAGGETLARAMNDRQNERTQFAGLPLRRSQPYRRSQNQSAQRIASLELDTSSARGLQGGLNRAVTVLAHRLFPRLRNRPTSNRGLFR